MSVLQRSRAWPRLLMLVVVVVVVSGCGAEAEIPSSGAAPGQSFAPPARAADATVLAIVGDAGELEDDTLAVAALVDAHQPDAVITAGDNEYTTEGRTIASYEESVGGVYGDWVAASTFFPVPGDHDYGDACDDPSEPADLEPYLAYFDLPVGPEDETYYQVRIGDVDVFAIDSLDDCHRDGGAKLERQRAWLEAQVPQSDALMQIVVMHNPPYSSGTSHGSFEELRWDFASWGVDLVVAGDDHIYERSTHDNVVYLVNGLGGIEAHDLGDPIEGSQSLYADDFGAVFVTVDPGTASAGISFRTVDDRVIDQTTIGLGAGSATGNDGNAGDQGNAGIGSAPSSTSSTSSTLAVGATWQWQLQGELNTSYDVDVYDIDLFDVSASQIDDLHRSGRYVVCYFSAGSSEEWRDDAGEFPPSALGNPLDGWEGERWLDIRDPGVRAVLTERLQLAAAKGCDGVEPDNVTAFTNDTGFEISAGDQLDFNRSLADAAHELGLTIGLKNDTDQVDDLVDWFDFAVNEECIEYEECDVYSAFIAVGKPVFNAEYSSDFVADPASACERGEAIGMSTVVFSVELDDSRRIACGP